MKFKINRDHFSHGLQQVLNIVSIRSTMPILSNVLIEAKKDNCIYLTTTNLDIGIRACVQADEVEIEGEITLPVRRLAMVIRELPKVEVFFNASSANQAQVESGGSRFKFMGMPKDEFPDLATLNSSHSFVVAQEDLIRMLRSVSYAQSADINRHTLNGVHFNTEKGQLSLVATDGRRLAFISNELKESKKDGEDSFALEGQKKDFILPANTVTELERLLGKGNDVHFVFDERKVTFTIAVGDQSDTTSGLIDNIYLVSKVVEGDYPDYKEAIPKETQLRIKLERELMLECVNRAALVTSDKNHSVTIKITNNLLEIFASSTEYGESHESMAIQYEGEEIQLVFNPVFIIDLLKALPNDEVILELQNNMSPGVFKTNANFLCVIMPLLRNEPSTSKLDESSEPDFEEEVDD